MGRLNGCRPVGFASFRRALMCVFSDAIDLKERSSETLDFRRPFCIKPLMFRKSAIF